MRTVRSKEPEATRRLFFAKVTQLTVCECPVKTCSTLPELKLHSRTERSEDTLARCWPPGAQATPCTQSVCPCSISKDRPSSTSHTHTVLSQLPDTDWVESGEKATAAT